MKKDAIVLVRCMYRASKEKNKTGYIEQFLDDFDKEYPNIAKLLTNLKFSISMMNEIMNDLNNRNIDPKTAGLKWLKNNPDLLKKWFKGIKTVDNKDGLKSFMKYLRSFN